MRLLLLALLACSSYALEAAEACGDEVCSLKSKTSGWKYDVASVSAFYEFHGDGPPGTIDSGRHQIWFDDASTLGVKYSWCSANGIRGVGMWAATHVSYPSETASEMWGAIKLFTQSY